MIVERLNPSAAQPFDTYRLSEHCRVTGINRLRDEAVLCGLAAAAELERYADLALLTQTVRVTLDEWGRKNWLPLPIAPMVDPLSPVVTVDGAAFTDYAVIAGTRPALRLTGDKPDGLIVIEYTAGFGESHLEIPADLHLAILDQAAANFDVRSGVIGDGKKIVNQLAMSPHTARIAARYKRVAL